MSGLVDELRQYALMVANQMKANNKHDEALVTAAYERVKSFNGVICPECWVKDEQASELEMQPHPVKTSVYKCERCGFGSMFQSP